MRVYLIGITGCGKTTLGKQLAKKLGCTLVDLDDYIVGQQGRSISDIFENDGEAYFRALEHNALKEIDNSELVVSTGGGAPCFHENMSLMNEKGRTVWLNPDGEVVAERLLNSPNLSNRPMIAGKNRQEVLEFVRTKLKERQRFYAMAEVIITHNNITVDMIMNALKTEIN